MRRAPAATPRRRPDERPKKLTSRSASPSGNVFKMMASVSRAGIMSARRQRFAHCAALRKPQTQKRTIFLPHASLPRNFAGGFCGKISHQLTQARYDAGGYRVFAPRAHAALRNTRNRNSLDCSELRRQNTLLTATRAKKDYRTQYCAVRSRLLLFYQFRVRFACMPIPFVDFTGIGENATDVVLRLKDFPARDGKTDTVHREVR